MIDNAHYISSTQTDLGLRGRIFDIKRFAVHDGPGIRTTVFFKGCPLRCAWCHNPEAIHPQPELVLHEERCIACGACVIACPNGAHSLLGGNGLIQDRRIFYRDRCDLSAACVESCYSDALLLYGRTMRVEDVMAELRQDMNFYAQSGGGVTVSGGEPLVQAEFVLSLLRQCNEEGIHTALDTCGHVAWSAFEKLLPYVDLVLYDLKQMDAQVHERFTGVSNHRILANLQEVSGYGVPIEIRMPIIPTVNADQRDILAAAELLASLDNISAVRLLAYHSMAGSKYTRLGRVDALRDVEPPSDLTMQQIASWLRAYGLSVSY